MNITFAISGSITMNVTVSNVLKYIIAICVTSFFSCSSSHVYKTAVLRIISWTKYIGSGRSFWQKERIDDDDDWKALH